MCTRLTGTIALPFQFPKNMKTKPSPRLKPKQLSKVLKFPC